MYTHHLLDPRRTPAAASHNDEVLAAPVLGIEVTVPALAARCVLGNLDPQHGKGGTAATSAIEAALEHPLPPPGSRLATLRPDADAIGAMSVLGLRAAGRGAEIDQVLCEAIGRVDALGPRAYEMPLVASQSTAVRAALWQARAYGARIDATVTWMQALLTGAARADEVRALALLEIRQLDEARRLLRVTPLADRRVVLVEGNAPRALEVGYESGGGIVVCRADAFVRDGAAPGEAPVEKWTIARWSAREPLDVAGLTDTLNRLEREHGGVGTWGGPEGLVASPQGTATCIPRARVLEAVLDHVRDRGAGARPESPTLARGPLA